MGLEKHQKIAILIFFLVMIIVGIRDSQNEFIGKAIILFVFLLTIMFYRFAAFLASFGFMEYLAKDFKSDNNPGPYAFFFWFVYIIVCLFLVFNWSFQ